MPLFLVDNDASLLSETCNPPFVPLFVLVSNVILPTLEPLIFPTTVPLSPGPTS